MLQHQILIQKAKNQGIKTTDLSQLLQKPATILKYKNISELIIEGVPTSWINVRSQFYCDNKQLTKYAYQDLGIPYPKTAVFSDPSDPSLKAFFQKGKTYVCKPVDGTNGEGVVTEIRNLEMILDYYQTYHHLDHQFLLEEQVEGVDLRIHVMGGKIVAACIREPAFVIGNGKNTLSELIDQRREVMKTQNPGNKLEITETTQALLKQQNVGLEDIPEEDRKIRLKYVSNMAQGGIATDVTDEIHPAYHDWVAKLVDYLKTPYFGMDIMTMDYQGDPYQHASILEINARAEWLHHTFSERRKHDIAGMMLGILFFTV